MQYPFKVTLLLSYICIASVSAAIITPALPAIQHTFNLSHTALEWIVSLFLLGYVIGQLPYGPLANRFGRIRALQAGLILNCIGVVICIVATKFLNYPLLLTGRMLTALGSASGLSCTFMLLNESFSKEQTKQAMSFAVVSFTIGIGLAVTIGGIITQYLNWQYCFWILLLHGLVMLYLTKYFQETLIKPLKLAPLKVIYTLASTMRNGQLFAFSLLVGFVSAFTYGYSAVAPLFANQVLHLSAAKYGYWNIVNMFGMLGSGFLSAFLMKQYGAKRLLMIGILSLLPILALFLLLALWPTTSPSLFFITSAALYLFTGILFPAASYFASNALMDKANASSAMSFINMSTAMLCVIIIGYLPYSALMSFIIVLAFILLLTLLFIMPYLVKYKI